MYDFTSSFPFSCAIKKNEKKRKISQRRRNLVALNLKIGGVIKTPNGVETISGFNNALAQIETFSGHQYAPIEIIKVG